MPNETINTFGCTELTADEMETIDGGLPIIAIVAGAAALGLTLGAIKMGWL